MRIVGPEERQGDVAEDLARGRAVDRGRLLELLGDLLQAREVEDHVEAEVLPRDDDEDRVQDDARVGQPVVDERSCRPAASSVWSASRSGWRISDHTTAATTSESTNGREEEDPQQRAALQALVEDPGDPQRERAAAPPARATMMMALCFRAPLEDVVAEGALEVVEADEVRRRGRGRSTCSRCSGRPGRSAPPRAGSRARSAGSEEERDGHPLARDARAPRPLAVARARARACAGRPGPRPARPGGWGAPPGLPEPMPSA